jgi:hypothetical protein
VKDDAPVDDRVVATAEGQEGAINARQLRAAGLSRAQIGRRARSGRLRATAARGVYRLPGAPGGWRQELWIAILAAPAGAAVSHGSAAALHGLLDPPSPPHITVPRTASGRFAGAAVHHGSLTWADRCRLTGLPATGVARTVVDCAAVLDRSELNGLIDAAIGRGLTTARRVRSAWDRAGAVRGADRLAEALAPYSAGAPPGSVKEAHLLRLFREWGLPTPVCQYVIRDAGGRFIARVDFGWPRWRFGLEYDGDEFHSPRLWAADDRRRGQIEAVGWRIERADRFDVRPSATRLRTLLTHVLREPA